jgi:murein DD-endopeptidase MepM/ murein hydrolase activator NlpD
MLVHGRKITVPQRYAIDFHGLNRNGRGIRGALKGSSNTDWFGFGADVVAVADSLVREARDGIADNPPLFEPPPPASVELSATGGNYVVLDLGRDRFVHYAHLQQGSVTVRDGQRVRRGQLLGRLGNSGNTNGAHLHFNVLNGPRVSEAEGLPYVFDAFVVRGTTTADAVFGDDPPTPPDKSQSVRRALPLNGTIVEFPHD